MLSTHAIEAVLIGAFVLVMGAGMLCYFACRKDDEDRP